MESCSDRVWRCPVAIYEPRVVLRMLLIEKVPRALLWEAESISHSMLLGWCRGEILSLLLDVVVNCQSIDDEMLIEVCDGWRRVIEPPTRRSGKLSIDGIMMVDVLVVGGCGVVWW